MGFITKAVQEIWGLFVDDWIFAAALILWIAVCGGLRHVLGSGNTGIVMAVGFAVLTVAFTTKRAAE